MQLTHGKNGTTLRHVEEQVMLCAAHTWKEWHYIRLIEEQVMLRASHTRKEWLCITMMQLSIGLMQVPSFTQHNSSNGPDNNSASHKDPSYIGLARTVYIYIYIYTPYMTVYLVNSVPKIPYVHRICMVLANPTHTMPPPLPSNVARSNNASCICTCVQAGQPPQTTFSLKHYMFSPRPCLALNSCIAISSRVSGPAEFEGLTTSECMHIGWPELYMYTVFDRIFGDFPAKTTVYTPYMHGSGQP